MSGQRPLVKGSILLSGRPEAANLQGLHIDAVGVRLVGFSAAYEAREFSVEPTVFEAAKSRVGIVHPTFSSATWVENGCEFVKLPHEE